MSLPNAEAFHNEKFAHYFTTEYIINEDTDLADLDSADYDSFVVKDARIERVVEVKLVGSTPIPVNKDGENVEGGP